MPDETYEPGRLWEATATDEEIATAILADINYKRIPWERAVVVTAAHVKRIRQSVQKEG